MEPGLQGQCSGGAVGKRTSSSAVAGETGLNGKEARSLGRKALNAEAESWGMYLELEVTFEQGATPRG